MGCDPNDNRLNFLNLSRHSVIAEISNDSSTFNFNNVSYYKRKVVLSNSILVFPRMGSSHAMVDYVDHGMNKMLYLVVFSVDTINKYSDKMSMDLLFKQKKYSKLLACSKKELLSQNWMISYKK